MEVRVRQICIYLCLGYHILHVRFRTTAYHVLNKVVNETHVTRFKYIIIIIGKCSVDKNFTKLLHKIFMFYIIY